MERKKKLPIGIEFFKDFRRDDFYYVDKTGFIRDLVNMRGLVNLFTRPRRFGKSLNMDMLKTFFEIGTDPSYFEGLEISREKAICEEHMGQGTAARETTSSRARPRSSDSGPMQASRAVWQGRTWQEGPGRQTGTFSTILPISWTWTLSDWGITGLPGRLIPTGAVR